MRDILSIGFACLLGIVGMLVIIDLFVVPADSEPGATIAVNAVPAEIRASGETATAAAPLVASAIPAVRDVTKDPYVSGPPPAAVMERLQQMAEADGIPRPRARPSVDEALTEQASFDDDVETHTVTVFAAHEGGPVMRVVEVRAAPERPRIAGKPRCTTFKTYNPETGTYRGYDGLIHECRAS